MNTHLKNQPDNFSIGLGMMSGTSLDGIDLAICSFKGDNLFDLLHFETIKYPLFWKEKLENAHRLTGLELRKLEIEYSEWVAETIQAFLQKTATEIYFIACHGHTVFHQPNEKLTLQILDGSIISAITQITTVCDFRSGDVALGGEGAPLVPIGDELLFSNYNACLNLGGFANVSYRKEGKRVAYDIAPANIILNHLARQEKLDYDHNGAMAKSGTVIPDVLKKLNSLEYYAQPFPKSLGREWVETHVLNLFKNTNTAHALATATEHISTQIANVLNSISQNGEVLVTGGGAHNLFLMNRLSAKTTAQIIIPPSDIIDAKEAIIFAFLGKLRLDEKINILSSVTGAQRDSIGGCVYL